MRVTRLVPAALVSMKLFARQLFVFRDDLVTKVIADQHFCGFSSLIAPNKLRKFKFLIEMKEFPLIVSSYGGYQSNAMAALSEICFHKKARFMYFTKRMNPDSLARPTGNLKRALANGAEIHSLDSEVYKKLTALPKQATNFPVELLKSTLEVPRDSKVFWVPQGAAMAEIEEGVRGLVFDIKEAIDNERRLLQNDRPWKIFFATGTGAMAFFSSRQFHDLRHSGGWPVDVEVVALPCSTTSEALKKELEDLDKVCGCRSIFPTILADPIKRKRTFGELNLELFLLFKYIQRKSGQEFDLLYAPRAFEIIQNNIRTQNPLFDDSQYNLLYYNCGGVEGNMSMLERYHAAGISEKARSRPPHVL